MILGVWIILIAIMVLLIVFIISEHITFSSRLDRILSLKGNISQVRRVAAVFNSEFSGYIELEKVAKKLRIAYGILFLVLALAGALFAMHLLIIPGFIIPILVA